MKVSGFRKEYSADDGTVQGIRSNIFYNLIKLLLKLNYANGKAVSPRIFHLGIFFLASFSWRMKSVDKVAVQGV